MLPHRRLLYRSSNSSFRAFLNNFHDVIFTSFVSSFDRRGRVDRHIHYFFFFLFVHAILLSMYRHRGLVCSAASHCITISRLHVRTLYVKRRILGFQTVKVSRFSTRGGRKSSVLTKRLVKQQTQAEEEGVEPWLLGLTAMLHCRGILS